MAVTDTIAATRIIANFMAKWSLSFFSLVLWILQRPLISCDFSLVDSSRCDQPCARKARYPASRSCDQRLVGQANADSLVAQGGDAIQRVNLAVTFVQSERSFVHVALHVLDGEMVVNAVIAALEDSPHTFDAIRVRHPVNVLLGAVIHRAMPVAVNTRIRRMRIGAEHRIIFDIRS